jgi:hypothetical protein
MIEQILIISFWVFAIHYTMQHGEIFGWIGDWFSEVLPEKLHNPVFDCEVCMCPWYGSFLYIIMWKPTWHEFGIALIVVIAATGLNAILTKLFPKDPDPEEIGIFQGR